MVPLRPPLDREGRREDAEILVLPTTVAWPSALLCLLDGDYFLMVTDEPDDAAPTRQRRPALVRGTHAPRAQGEVAILRVSIRVTTAHGLGVSALSTWCPA